MTAQDEQANNTFFVYWGRRGAMSWFTLELARVLNSRNCLAPSISASASNELAHLFSQQPAIKPFPTFSKNIGAVIGFPIFLKHARELLLQLKERHFRSVVVLMPHMWTPAFGVLVRNAGLQYAVVVHDAERHPGDATGLVNWWLMQDALRADTVFTLSENVSGQLTRRWSIPATKIQTLFHPSLSYGEELFVQRPRDPLRVLFFGRILAYKGIDLLITAVEQLRIRGIQIQLGIFGEGNLYSFLPRLRLLKADVVNQWVDHTQVAAILAAYDVVVLPYHEASQSGTAAVALGAGLPVIATPIGGLTEQIQHGVNGLIANAVTSEALADCLAELARDSNLYLRLRDYCLAERHRLSMDHFLNSLLTGLQRSRSPTNHRP